MSAIYGITESQTMKAEPDYIETWTPYQMGSAISESRMRDILLGRNGPYTLCEIVKAKESGAMYPKYAGRELP